MKIERTVFNCWSLNNTTSGYKILFEPELSFPPLYKIFNAALVCLLPALFYSVCVLLEQRCSICQYIGKPISVIQRALQGDQLPSSAERNRERQTLLSGWYSKTVECSFYHDVFSKLYFVHMSSKTMMKRSRLLETEHSQTIHHNGFVYYLRLILVVFGDKSRTINIFPSL